MFIGLIIGFISGLMAVITINHYREKIHLSSFISELDNKKDSVAVRAEYFLYNIVPKLTDTQLYALPYEELEVMYRIWGDKLESAELNNIDYAHHKFLGLKLLKSLELKRSIIQTAQKCMQDANA